MTEVVNFNGHFGGAARNLTPLPLGDSNMELEDEECFSESSLINPDQKEVSKEKGTKRPSDKNDSNSGVSERPDHPNADHFNNTTSRMRLKSTSPVTVATSREKETRKDTNGGTSALANGRKRSWKMQQDCRTTTPTPPLGGASADVGGPSPFKRLALSFVQKLSPGKRLRDDQIDFDRLKTAMLSELSVQRGERHSSTTATSSRHHHRHRPQSSTTNPTRPHRFEKLTQIGLRTHRIVQLAQRSQSKRGPPLAASASCTSLVGSVQSQQSTSSSSNGGGWTRTRDRSESSSSASLTQSARAEQRAVRRLSDTRRRRREARECAQLIQLDSDRFEFSSMALTLRSRMESMLADGEGAVRVYQILLNTLHHHFDQDTFTELVPKLTREFIANNLLLSTTDLKNRPSFYKEDTEIAAKGCPILAEFELQTLLELAAIDGDESGRLVSDTSPTERRAADVIQAVQKLRAISLLGSAQAGYLNGFLETLVDEFLDSIPYHLVEIYDQIGASALPPDLQVFAGGGTSVIDDVVEPGAVTPPSITVGRPRTSPTSTTTKGDKNRSRQPKSMMPADGGSSVALDRRAKQKQRQMMVNGGGRPMIGGASSTNTQQASRCKHQPPTMIPTKATQSNSAKRKIDAGALTPSHSLPCDSRLLRRLIIDSGPPPTDGDSSPTTDVSSRSPSPPSPSVVAVHKRKGGGGSPRRTVASAIRGSLEARRAKRILLDADGVSRLSPRNHPSTLATLANKISHKSAAIVPPTRAAKRKIGGSPAKLQKRTKSIDRSAFLANVIQSSEKDSEAKANVTRDTPSKSTTKSPDARTPRSRASTATRNLFEALSPPSVAATSSAINDEDDGSHDDEDDEATFSLPQSAIDGYREYVQKLRQAKYKGRIDENEVFYGRGRPRENVFERTPVDGPSTRLKRGTDGQQSATKTVGAKNRTGRKVREKAAADGVFHVAHYLLNVNNSNPNTPLVPKSLAMKLKSPLKLQKLLRRPSKARRRRLDRMLEKALADASRSDAKQIQSVTTPTDAKQMPPPTATITRKLSVDVTVDAQALRRIERTLMLSPRNGAARRSTRQSSDSVASGQRRRSLSISVSELTSIEGRRRSSRSGGEQISPTTEKEVVEVKTEAMDDVDDGDEEEELSRSPSPIFHSSLRHSQHLCA